MYILAWQHLLAFFRNKSSKDDYSASSGYSAYSFSFITFHWYQRITLIVLLPDNKDMTLAPLLIRQVTGNIIHF